MAPWWWRIRTCGIVTTAKWNPSAAIERRSGSEVDLATLRQQRQLTDRPPTDSRYGEKPSLFHLVRSLKWRWNANLLLDSSLFGV